MKQLSLFLMLLFLFSSCKKDEFLEKNPEWIGDYDWIFSEISYGDSIIDLSNSPDRYGFRILKKGKVKFYKNGKEQMTGEISDNHTDGFIYIYLKKENQDWKLKFYDGEIRLTNFPHSDYSNVFKRITK